MDEAAKYLRISRRKLEQMKAAGTGPVRNRIGGKILYRKIAIDSFIESQAMKEKA